MDIETQSNNNSVTQIQKPKSFPWFSLSILIIISIILGCVVYITGSPKEFPQNTYLKVEPKTSVFAVSYQAQEAHIVRSARVLQALIILFGGEHKLSAGDYYFTSSVPVWVVAERLATRNFNSVPVRVTLPEGMTRKEMATLLHTLLPNFDTALFLEETKDQEGFLFPDTYFFSANITTHEVINRLHKNYEAKLETLQPDIVASGHSEREIITFASILEKEAQGDADRAIISGILWNRLAKHMLLQVDASFLYLLNKQSDQVTQADLAIDSPYNTYRYFGLPPGPINNPGLETIKATLHPTTSRYLFYLHDKDGTAHFAETFAQHKKNKILYLH